VQVCAHRSPPSPPTMHRLSTRPVRLRRKLQVQPHSSLGTRTNPQRDRTSHSSDSDQRKLWWSDSIFDAGAMVRAMVCAVLFLTSDVSEHIISDSCVQRKDARRQNKSSRALQKFSKRALQLRCTLQVRARPSSISKTSSDSDEWHRSNGTVNARAKVCAVSFDFLAPRALHLSSGSDPVVLLQAGRKCR